MGPTRWTIRYLARLRLVAVLAILPMLGWPAARDFHPRSNPRICVITAVTTGLIDAVDAEPSDRPDAPDSVLLFAEAGGDVSDESSNFDTTSVGGAATSRPPAERRCHLCRWLI
ncbi:MAG: hypothetical protein KDA32_05430 [Phycisphaerales bacterium]|nr:hypothetical protein [Phycisphaerales bacterium]